MFDTHGQQHAQEKPIKTAVTLDIEKIIDIILIMPQKLNQSSLQES